MATPRLGLVVEDKPTELSCIHIHNSGSPRIHEVQDVALYVYIFIYLYVCGVIISMSKELNFESRTWVMVVNHVYHVYVLLKAWTDFF